MGKEEKLRLLRESYESGSITKEEHDRNAEEIEKEKEPEIRPTKETEHPKISDKYLIIGIVLMISAFAAVLAFAYFGKEQPKTIEEMHIANLQNELPAERGYVYKGAYSFVNIDGFWFTQIASRSGRALYDLSMRYSPRELENVKLNGWLNATLFNSATEYYVTFDPTGKDFSHVALAAGDFNTHMVNAFLKTPIAACDKNETEPCSARPIVTCENTKKEVVLYIRESDNFRVSYDNNCIMVEGKGFDLVKGVDRILYDFYGMMGSRNRVE